MDLFLHKEKAATRYKVCRANNQWNAHNGCWWDSATKLAVY